MYESKAEEYAVLFELASFCDADMGEVELLPHRAAVVLRRESLIATAESSVLRNTVRTGTCTTNTKCRFAFLC